MLFTVSSIALKFYKLQSGRFAATSVSRGEGPTGKQRVGVWGPPRPPEALGLLVNKLYTLGLFEPMTA